MKASGDGDACLQVGQLLPPGEVTPQATFSFASSVECTPVYTALQIFA
jgi:hypothetical protein